MDLSGSVPITGRVLVPKKRGSLAVAFYDGSSRPAALLDRSGTGRVLVMPFPLTHSAYRAGAGAPYSLLVRAAVLAIVPEKDEPGGPEAAGLSLASPSGPVRVRIRMTPPPGSQLLWAGAEGKLERNAVLYEIETDRQQRSLYYLYQSHIPGAETPSAEIFIEQNGAYRSQGIIK